MTRAHSQRQATYLGEGSAVPASLAPGLGPVLRAAALVARLPAAVTVGAVVAVVTGLDVWWRTIERRPPHWDMGHHLSNSLLYLHGFSLHHPLWFLETYLYYPPLVYWVTDLFYVALGSQAMWVAIVSNAAWLAVLAYATYGIGRTLWSTRVAWMSVVFVLASPTVVSSFKEYMLDGPLTALAALSVYLLIRSEKFSKRAPSLLLGVTCGCGLLTKWTFPVVMALPAFHGLAGALHVARRRRSLGPLANVASAAALATVVAGTWYVHNFRLIGGGLLYSGGGLGAVEGDPPVGSASSVLWYVWNLLNVQLYLVPFLLVLAGVVACLCRRELATRNAYPLLLAVGVLIGFTLLRNKDARYTMPMLPGLAVVATSWLDRLGARARSWAAVAVATYGVVAFLAISFGTSLVPRALAVGLPASKFNPGSVVVFAQHGYLIGPPTSEDWHQAELFTTIADFPKAERSFAFQGPESIWFNKHGLNYYSLRYGASWADPGKAHFLVERGVQPRVRPGYVRLRQWRLPDGGALTLDERA